MLPTANAAHLLMAASLLALGACTHSATDSFPFQSVGEPTRSLHVETFDGDIHLVEDPNARRVHGTVHVLARGFNTVTDARRAAGEVRVVETGTADDLILTVDLPPRSGSQRFEVTLDLFVPPGVATSSFADRGALTFAGVPVIEATTFGPIELVGTRGAAKLKTEQAPIFVEAHQGALIARTVNASITALSVFGEVDARTTNGPIEARVTPPPGGEVVLTTLNAPVDLVLPSNFGATLVVSTSPEAAIAIDLPFVTPEFLAPGQFEGYVGNGAGYVDVRTTNADVLIRDR